MDTTDPLVADFLTARRIRDRAQADLDEAQDRLIKQMEQDQRKSFKWTDEGWSRTVTYVQAHTTVIDEAGLRKALGARAYDRYTIKKLDRRAMEKAMDEGTVDPITVSRYVTLKPNKPHLSLTEKEINDA